MRSNLISSTALAVLLMWTGDVSAHCRIWNTYGDVGGSNRIQATSLAYRSDIERSAKGDQFPFQFDTSVFSSPIIPATNPISPYLHKPRTWLAQGCGATLSNLWFYWEKYPAQFLPYGRVHPNTWPHIEIFFYNRPIDGPVFTQTKALTLQNANAGKIIQATEGGYIHMMIFQINADGAGPFRCRIDSTGTGDKFGDWIGYDKWIMKGAEGKYGTNAWGNYKTHDWRIRLPKPLKCTGQYGKVKNVCMLRCENQAPNGPFGGCIPFQVIYPKPPVTVTTTVTGSTTGATTISGSATVTVRTTVTEDKACTTTVTSTVTGAATGVATTTTGKTCLVMTTTVEDNAQPACTTTVTSTVTGAATGIATNTDGKTCCVTVTVTGKKPGAATQATVTRTTPGPKSGTSTIYVTNEDGETVTNSGTVSVIITTPSEAEPTPEYEYDGDSDNKKRDSIIRIRGRQVKKFIRIREATATNQPEATSIKVDTNKPEPTPKTGDPGYNNDGGKPESPPVNDPENIKDKKLKEEFEKNIKKVQEEIEKAAKQLSNGKPPLQNQVV
ncbi:hypothetical protein H072_6493 [Dactylellina haptotyla CBS 200.50]|uniref:Uncharacterized protein n=1 Tax=Dactylellina haptotyla (strain CBS 200.50) TaxID=1284197 RepID=S8A9N7_DACHA|nr:hypothetical protein H072_6493 [Dactylellina haptotyla CBS 200.50]